MRNPTKYVCEGYCRVVHCSLASVVLMGTRCLQSKVCLLIQVLLLRETTRSLVNRSSCTMFQHVIILGISGSKVVRRL